MRRHMYDSGRVSGIVIFLLLVAVAGAAFVGGRKVFSTFKEDWKTVERIREGDAEQVRAERDAGALYIDKLKLTLTAAAAGQSENGLKVNLTGKILNAGAKQVIKAVAEVTFLPANPKDEPLVKEVILFDGSELSVTTDKPLSSGEERTIWKTVDDVSPSWSQGRITYRVTQARVETARP